ncbi:MAG: hypothetical protein IIX72_00620 [Oscillospiraceae bacterium]|nr:hypothetical protein [Oscillospiraceae bacterium]
MKIYIDVNDGYKCYASDKGGLLEYEDEFFDGKCVEFIEGYVCKPVGYEQDGKYADVTNIYPWKNYSELYIAQLEYELADADAALAELGVTFNA